MQPIHHSGAAQRQQASAHPAIYPPALLTHDGQPVSGNPSDGQIYKTVGDRTTTSPRLRKDKDYSQELYVQTYDSPKFQQGSPNGHFGLSNFISAREKIMTALNRAEEENAKRRESEKPEYENNNYLGDLYRVARQLELALPPVEAIEEARALEPDDNNFQNVVVPPLPTQWQAANQPQQPQPCEAAPSLNPYNMHQIAEPQYQQMLPILHGYNPIAYQPLTGVVQGVPLIRQPHVNPWSPPYWSQQQYQAPNQALAHQHNIWLNNGMCPPGFEESLRGRWR